MDHQTLKVIVQKICDWGFDEYVDKVKFAAKNLPAICYSVYSKVGATFLPLPKKSHYLFNMRDLMKVVQGVIRVPASKYDAVGDSKTSLLRLWVHESMRVYSDRLVDSDDQQQFRDILNETLDLEFALHLDQVLNTGDEPLRPKSMLYGNFLEVHSVAR
jgi:dynein heavy chain